MDAWKEGMEWIHKERRDGMDIGTEGMQCIHRERVLSGYRERGY